MGQCCYKVAPDVCEPYDKYAPYRVWKNEVAVQTDDIDYELNIEAETVQKTDNNSHSSEVVFSISHKAAGSNIELKKRFSFISSTKAKQSPFCTPVHTTEAHSGVTNNGKKTLNDYILLDKLGSGSYGKVKLCLNEVTGKYYAMKIINRSLLNKITIDKKGRPVKKDMNLVKKEVAILKKLRHRNVVKMYELIDDPTEDKLYILLEHVEGGAIMKVDGFGGIDREPFGQEKTKKYLRDIIRGLEYLHSNKVIHRDIKPENLLVDENDNIKLTDFGVSHMFDGDNDILHTSAGTPAFLSPEACSVGYYRGKPADIWATGVTIYVMLFGRVPFNGDSVLDIYNSILYEKPVYPPYTDPLVVDLLDRLLCKNPEDRITLQQLKQHPWITNNGSSPMEPAIEGIDHRITLKDINEAISEGRSMKMIDKLRIVSKVSTIMLSKAQKAKSVVENRDGGLKKNTQLPPIVSKDTREFRGSSMD
ncbi:calmodulin dependent protein kinase kinase [Acrasis kona]|uniref:Calmodulin dependent protein kinase kinase n=1 Tax=Acrasis kona TaxID=1008807 RepID=A0AAW2ZPP7_9EUKA